MKTIVMTGGTAGIGLAAAERMQSPDVRLLIGARRHAPIGESRPLDLTRLESVRRFAADAEAWLGDARIDGLVLNAGLQVADVKQRTEDGFETTFAANHLAHYLLLRLLMPRLAPGASVVITTSDLHDPKTNRLAPPEHTDAERLARGQLRLRDGATDRLAVMRAYATSKLCNLMTARALASSDLARARMLRVVAYNPGFTPGTQLIREHAPLLRFFFAMVMPVLRPIFRMNTVASGGAFLADLSLGRIEAPAGRLYASQRRRELTWPEYAALANDAATSKLWRESAALVGMSDD